MCLPNIFSLMKKLQDVVYVIYLLIFLQTLEFIRFICKLFVPTSPKSLAFFITVFFFYLQFKQQFHTRAFAFLFFWRFAFLFFSLGSRSRWRRWLWLTRFYHFTSFHNHLFYWHFTNKMYIFLLIFLASIGNIKATLLFTPWSLTLHKYFGKSVA